ncbi:MAG: HAMP domain-containing sensor histidine kinase [Bacteroidota bacterium]
MNKKAISIIIGLMIAALIGITLSQISLIRSAVELKEDHFEQDVQAALNAVVERIEEQERLEARMNYNGYAARSSRNNKKNDPVILSKGKGFGEFANEPAELTNQYELYRIRNAKRPLVERFTLEEISNYIDKELEDHGIRSKYEYGVFSEERKSMVIENGHYVIEEAGAKDFLPDQKNLFTTNYRVHFLNPDGKTAGWLSVFFPNESAFVWKQVWVNILASILFTLLILFCFAYTINVIITQKKLSSMKTDFINNMTHEFKTPIATISLAADSITSPMIAGKSDKVQRFANIIKQENKRMNSQVEKVLQMAMLDKKDFKLKLTQLDLHEIINSAIENINLQVEKKDGKAYADLKAGNAFVEGDMTHISNIINNLLDNANKYSPDEPEISVHTRNVPNGVEVIVKDRGIGMSKEARKNIFDKFYRVHTGDLHDVKGFGLGLSYVKAMITAHKGVIDVKSELGKGSSFILFFPFRVNSGTK